MLMQYFWLVLLCAAASVSRGGVGVPEDSGQWIMR